MISYLGPSIYDDRSVCLEEREVAAWSTVNILLVYSCSGNRWKCSLRQLVPKNERSGHHGRAHPRRKLSSEKNSAEKQKVSSCRLQDNHPKLGVTQLELSPFYLQEARKNLDYWRSRRGGPSPEDSAAHKDRFLHAAAEDIPVENESYDVVSSCPP